MAVTLASLRPKVRRRISAQVADSYLTTDVIDDYINEAVQQFCSEADWPWLETTSTFPCVANQTVYSINAILGTTEWYRIHSLIDPITGLDLELRQIQEVDKLNFPVGQQAMASQVYGIFGDQLYIAPPPVDNRSVQVRWYQREPALVGDNDTLLMPDTANWTTGIIEYTAYLCLRQLREDARAESAYTAYTRWVARAKDEKWRNHSSIRIRIREGSLL